MRSTTPLIVTPSSSSISSFFAMTSLTAIFTPRGSLAFVGAENFLFSVYNNPVPVLS